MIAPITITNIGLILYFLYTNNIIAKITMLNQENILMLNNISKFNNVDKNKSKVAAKISPTTNGLIPLKTCLTILLSLNLSSILAMINITIILGATNDKVEITPPNGPKVIYPT